MKANTTVIGDGGTGCVGREIDWGYAEGDSGLGIDSGTQI